MDDDLRPGDPFHRNRNAWRNLLWVIVALAAFFLLTNASPFT